MLSSTNPPLEPFTVRLASPKDATAIATLSYELWSGEPLAVHLAETRATLEGRPPSTLPLVIFVAEHRGEIIGFIEVGMRSHADGCNPIRPVGFIEGWFVHRKHRRKGVGAALMSAAESWARDRGCREMGSDTWLDAAEAQRAHEALGFSVVDRCVNYRKTL